LIIVVLSPSISRFIFVTRYSTVKPAACVYDYDHAELLTRACLRQTANKYIMPIPSI